TRGVVMVCVCYIELRGGSAHVRYLLRRLRQRMPAGPLLVGFWSSDDSFVRDEGLQRAIGANFYVTSLHDAVEACLEVAHAAPEALSVG
ncbi:MAG: AI-2E family transporter, partial [Chloroflexi bacterium]|nr:AI-2E family transporter [Chloroflexota bacterium]